MPTSIFSKIIAGQIPCFMVYEDDLVFSFLDINPLSRGHTLVIPKEPAITLDALSDESAAAIGRVLPKISRAVLNATGATAFNLLQNNGTIAHQAVMHVHFHIIPRYPSGLVRKGEQGRLSSGTGLSIDWTPGTLESSLGPELARSIAAAVR